MCVIFQRDANFKIPYDKFESSVIVNPDGFGFSYPNNGRLVTVRNHNKPDPEKLYRYLHEDLGDRDIMVHLRYTTAGATVLRNAHPFPVLERDKDGIDIRMAHNGTLYDYNKGINGESDTRYFVRNFVRPLFKRLKDPENALQDPFVEALLDNELSPMSVLSFIDSNGNSLQVNAKGNGGDYEDGWWFSNKYSFNPDHRKKKVQTRTTGNIGTQQIGKGTTVPTDVPQMGKAEMKFSDKYEVRPQDLKFLDDETIKHICDRPKDAALLIKELIYMVNQ